ncbi:MAG: translation initiation factor IF-3 [Anaerolineae bacterium]|nr:translation initiation factor IF-3 [Anaerolineae bacterium]
MTTPEYRINRQIRAREVRLIIEEEDGKSRNMGVLPLARALEIAEDMELDLVEVAPEANPPVCKIQDFGKFQYEKQRRERKARKQQKNIEVKEVQFGPKTDGHHLTFKVRDARRWIEEGMKVKVRVKFKGREITHPEIGLTKLEQIIVELQDVAVVEQKPSLEGRSMLMVLAPLPEKK